MRGLQWSPYRWDPVIRPDEDLRLSLRHGGDVQGMEALVGGEVRKFTLSPEGAELVIPADETDRIRDRTPVVVRVKTGGVWTVLTEGHVVRRVL